MADRTDLPKIKPDTAPSMLNTSAGTWGFLAGAVGTVVGMVTGKTIRAVNISMLAGSAIGAIAGGMSGKARQEKEQIEGRVVKTPGYWNAGIVGGMLASGVLFNAASALTGMQLSSAAIPLVSAVALGAVGSIMRKGSLQRDFYRAVAVRDSQVQEMQARLRTQELMQGAGYKNSVTRDEAAVLAEKQEQQPKSHVEMNEKLAEQHQEAARA